jgi:hypothetical protein
MSMMEEVPGLAWLEVACCGTRCRMELASLREGPARLEPCRSRGREHPTAVGTAPG